MRRARRAGSCAGAAVLAALLSASGCSWTFTKPLSDRPSPLDEPDCSTSLVPPVIDAVASLSNAATAGYLATQDNVSYQGLRVAVGVTAAAIWLSSAVYGFTRTHACQAARDDFKNGYHPPEFGTGGEVFVSPPPPVKPAASRPGN